MNKTLPSFLDNMAPPPAGAGVHKWLFSMARQMHAHLPAVAIMDWLENKTANCGRSVPRREIAAAVQNALGCAWAPSRGVARFGPAAMSRWPPVNQDRRKAIIEEGGNLANLWEMSPVRFGDNEEHAEAVIDRLFPGNPLLCCGASSQVFDTKPREDWRGQLAGLSLIVPSPMTAITGVTQGGKVSAHSLSNTGARRFLVCEFDTGTIDGHAALLIHLGAYATLVCAVFSGGKSLHGWFAVPGLPDEQVGRFFRYAVSLGADPALWTRSQFCRMPDGMRDNGGRQTVFFLNFGPLKQ